MALRVADIADRPLPSRATRRGRAIVRPVAHIRDRPQRADAQPPAARPVSLNTLSVRWRIALNAAQEALRATNATWSTKLPAAALHERTGRLAREREAVAELLQSSADAEHVTLVRRLNVPSLSTAQLGLRRNVRACVFDLDGVHAASTELHFTAWAETLDDFLSRRFEQASGHLSHYQRFSRRADYDEYLHGKPRLEGIRAFLASRGITLPEGAPDDLPESETVYGLANRKNEALRRRLEREGVRGFAGSHRFLETAAAAGLLCAVVSASANTPAILERAALADLVDVCIDGNIMRAAGLRSKPAPDTLLAACSALGVDAAGTAAFETSPDGIAAARSAGISTVVAVDRGGAAATLRAARPDLLVGDLSELFRRA